MFVATFFIIVSKNLEIIDEWVNELWYNKNRYKNPNGRILNF